MKLIFSGLSAENGFITMLQKENNYFLQPYGQEIVAAPQILDPRAIRKMRAERRRELRRERKERKLFRKFQKEIISG